ncbi:MAG: hypothetical protein CGW95_16735 [Phenylobacterium zucineum]|nr:MAG: hypothetical protein CGW95_16735 [Phenylobacterium zucineum]
MGRTDTGPNPKAPPFREIAAGYEEHSLQKRLTDIDETGHYDMPPIRVHSNDISDLIAYFNRLSRTAPETVRPCPRPTACSRPAEHTQSR